MARQQLKLDEDTAKDMEAMRKEEPIIERAAPEPEETEVKVEDKKTEIKEEIKTEKPEKPEVEKTVPLAALQEERKRNRDREELVNRRLELLMQATQPKVEAPKPIEIPDPEKDAMGSLKMTHQQVQDLVKFKNEYEAERQQEAAKQAILSEAGKQEGEFIALTPDYNDASHFLINSRRQELLASGMYSPAQVGKILEVETIALAQQALQAGRNPAEAVYSIAKARGYAKKEAAPVKAQETEAEKLERIAAGQAASKSLGAAGGALSPSGAKMDAKTLANMPDEEFEKLYNSLSRADKKALMGN